MVGKEHLECVCLQNVIVAVWACVCVRSVEIVSPLYPTSRITRGSVLFSRGDSQSVLALQYTEKNCNIQETSSVAGPSILQAHVGWLNLNMLCE